MCHFAVAVPSEQHAARHITPQHGNPKNAWCFSDGWGLVLGEIRSSRTLVSSAV